MAETIIDLRISWENNQSFEAQSQEDSGPVLTIAKMDENGHISTLWPALTDIMERYIKALMVRIGEEMASS